MMNCLSKFSYCNPYIVPFKVKHVHKARLSGIPLCSNIQNMLVRLTLVMYTQFIRL